MIRYLVLLFALVLHGHEHAKYTGSLLCDPPTAIPYGHFVLRNFVFFDDHRGLYQRDGNPSARLDSYNSFQYQLQTFFGLNSFFDLSLSPRFYCTYKGRYAYCNTGDLTAGLDLQLLDDEKFAFLPGIKFAVREVFPLGNYQFFNLKRGNMEKTGSGCFSTQIALFFYKGYLLSSHWLFSTTLELQYQINSPAAVKGLHAYGGGLGADGTLLVGNAWQSLLDFQLFYRQAFSLAFDLLYEHQDASPFYGHPGLSFSGTSCTGGQPSSERLSLAPSFSYQFPSQVGIMAGTWISIWGRNTEQFVQYVANVFYIF